MRFLLATRNADKVREIQEILGPAIALASLQDVGAEYEPEEDEIESGDTFHANAIAKATYFARRTGMIAIADDSGLVVHALEGEPGVNSKRFSGRDDLKGKALDDANNLHLLERLQDVPDPERTAHYVCATAVASPSRTLLLTLGTCSGRILRSPEGNEGFGYDPLFQIPEIGVTFGSLAPDQKNRRSHRARAFRALAAQITRLRDEGLTNET